jgi:hypothetical protein
MSERLKGFLVNLAANPDRMRRFADNPAAEIAAAGLTDSETAAILSGDSDQIRTAMGAAPADHMTQTGQKKKGRKAKNAKTAGKAKKGMKAARKASKKR